MDNTHNKCVLSRDDKFTEIKLEMENTKIKRNFIRLV